jgi:ABC-type taurine transport system substrate-binding protein
MHLMRRWLLLACCAAPLGDSKLFVRLGYFEEAMPWAVACVRGWMDTDEIEVGCFPQSSGGYAVSRLDVGDLDIATLGSTPTAVAFSRGVDLFVLQFLHGLAESQGLAVRGGGSPQSLVGKTLAAPFGSTVRTTT